MKGEKKRKKKKRKGRSSSKAKLRYGTLDFCMELTLGMDSIMDHMNFVWDSRKGYEFQI